MNEHLIKQRLREKLIVEDTHENIIIVPDWVEQSITRNSLILLSIVLIFFLTFAARSFRLTESVDLFLDEVTYFKLSESVRVAGWAELYGEPFHLHPPLQFYAQALFIQLTKPANNIFDQVYTARYLNILYACATALALFDITRRIAGIPWGIAAGFLFAIDPFIIRNNSLNLLDTGTLWWITLGYWILISGIHDGEHLKIPKWRIVLTGIAFGFGILTKDMGAFLTIFPLGGLFITGWFIPRIYSFFTSVVATLVYLIYPVAVVLKGEATYFYESKFSGFIRLLGLQQSTGLNREAGPSLSDKIFEKLLDFGVTYTLIAAGALAIIILLAFGKRRAKLVAVWSVGSYAMIAYAILFGTLEEQFFYFLLIPAIAAIPIMIEQLLLLSEKHAKTRGMLIITILAFIVTIVSFNTQVWVEKHTKPENSYEQIYNYLQNYAQPGEKIASSSETGQFVFGIYAGGPWGEWYTVEELLHYQPDYVMLNYNQLNWDYGSNADAMVEWVQEHGILVLPSSSTDNEFELYQLDFSEINH